MKNNMKVAENSFSKGKKLKKFKKLRKGDVFNEFRIDMETGNIIIINEDKYIYLYVQIYN